MIITDYKEFRRKAQKATLVPVVEEMLADLETPVSAFLKLTRGCRDERAFLLESVEGGENVGRYSYLGTNPSAVLQTRGREVTLHEGRKVQRFAMRKDPLAELEKIMKRYKTGPQQGLPQFWGGAVGYLAYDCVRFWEDLPDNNPDTMGFPDSVHFIIDTLVVFDHVAHTTKIIALAHIEGKSPASIKTAWNNAQRRIALTRRRLKADLPETAPAARGGRTEKWTSNLSRAQYKKAVHKCIEYIRAGDIFQVEMGRRLSKKTRSHAFNIYRQMRRINPSPYMYYFQDGSRRVVGASPEILVKAVGRDAVIRPIAGTRSRGKTVEEDLALEKELLSDPKERAEHVMMIDLARNDMGRVSEPGSVRVSESMVIERYSHVMHIVSEVVGKLRAGMSKTDLVRAAFPHGTMSGAPKIRAMEIIDELETVRRGPYTGSLGFFGFNGDLLSALLIRTLFVDGSTIHAQAAAGIVADSKPEAEFKETEKKLRAVIKAVELAETEKA